MSEPTRPRAFAVWFKDLKRWSVNSFFAIDWQWPAEYIHPLGTAITRKQNSVDRRKDDFKTLQLATIRFDGSIEPRNTEGKTDFKGALFVAEARDILYSKIDVRNGAIGIVPPELPLVAVSSEFPVYQVKPDIADPQYITLLFRTAAFRRTINSMISGASGRKRVQPEQLEEIQVPLPPLSIQKAIVARWEAAQAEVGAIQAHFVDMEGVTSRLVLDGLGVPAQEFRALPKAFALKWEEMERWSVEFLSRAALEVGKHFKEKYPTKRLSELCKGQSGGTPSKSNSAFWRGDMPWVSPKDMKAWELFDAIDHISEAALASSSAPLIAENSILLVVRSGILQRLVPIAINRVPVSINQDMRAFTVTDDRLLADFLAVYLQASQSKLMNLVKWSTTVQSINKEELESLVIPLPPLDVQREIVAQVQAQRAEIARLRADAERRAREIKADVEAWILGIKPIEEN